MELTPGLRRERPADLAAIGEDEALAARIRVEIERDGPMPFARFMELALYDPVGGYYRSATARPGRAGDFVTAPELHPIFGATFSTLLVEVWDRLGRPAPFTVREYGAGTGALAMAMLDGLRADGEPLLDVLEYEPVEVDPRRAAAFRERLIAAGHGDRLRPASGTRPMTGIVLANEVLDALPVHRVRRRAGALRELAVAVGPDGTFQEIEIEPTTPALAERLRAEGVELRDDQTAEIALAVGGWVAEATAGLRRGIALFIDYGYPAPELYDPFRRRDGTLRAYVAQQVHDDPYRHVGRQDLTAHVDVTAVEAAAHAAGLTTVGTTTQAEALIGLGVEDRLRAIQTDPATSMEAYLAVRASLVRLLDPAAMGRFRVMAFGRDWPGGQTSSDEPRLSAFRYSIPGRR